MIWQRPTGEARNLLRGHPACIDLHHPSFARSPVQSCVRLMGMALDQKRQQGQAAWSASPFPCMQAVQRRKLLLLTSVENLCAQSTVQPPLPHAYLSGTQNASALCDFRLLATPQILSQR